MKRIHSLAALAGLMLVAGACTSSPSGTGEGVATSTARSGGSSFPTAVTDAAPVGSTSASAEDTTTTTFSEETFDAIASARNALNSQVGQATAPWPTDWSMTTIDLQELQLGISRVDPRDSIPPIDFPEFESTSEAGIWLAPDEPGALVQLDGEARFYALSILHRHEIVNDEIAGVPVAVTYCPLCNTATAYDRRMNGAILRFGVSGLLRNSDLVMWDDQSVSLWQQVTGEAIVGQAAGERLTPISTSIVSFGDFAQSFPDGVSLSQNTGFGIAYGANPYRGYSSSVTPFLYDGETDPRYPALSRVVGVTINDEAKAYPFEVIEPLGTVNDVVGGVPIVVFWGGSTLDALDADRVATGQAIGTGVAYLTEVGEQTLTFSKSGEVWMDDETGSTWTLLGEAISGPLIGQRLIVATHRNEFWFAWGAFFPDASVFEG